jgi:hypothetical protein
MVDPSPPSLHAVDIAGSARAIFPTRPEPLRNDCPLPEPIHHAVSGVNRMTCLERLGCKSLQSASNASGVHLANRRGFRVLKSYASGAREQFGDGCNRVLQMLFAVNLGILQRECSLAIAFCSSATERLPRSGSAEAQRILIRRSSPAL